MALGAGNVQVCTAAMTYGFKIVQEMISGLSQYLDDKGIALDELIGIDGLTPANVHEHLLQLTAAPPPL